MFDDLKLKCMIRQIANNYMDYDDKVLSYIRMFECESKTKHDIIKNYISEFAPKIWEEFNEYITVKNMTNIVKNSQNEVNESSALDDIMRKIK